MKFRNPDNENNHSTFLNFGFIEAICGKVSESVKQEINSALVQLYILFPTSTFGTHNAIWDKCVT